MPFLFSPPPQAVLPIVGEKNLFFPINRVYLVGHNYAEHNRELNAPDEPVIFLKPSDVVVPVAEGGSVDIVCPAYSENFQHEVELVVALKSGGRDLTEEEAAKCVYGYAVGCDFTCRDWQFRQKDKKQPWEKAKTVDAALPVTPLRPAEAVPEGGLAIWLYVNSDRRQNGSTLDMQHSVPELISHLSKFWELRAGDIIFTGTPSGVGAVKPGDFVRAGVAGVGTMDLRMVSAR